VYGERMHRTLTWDDLFEVFNLRRMMVIRFEGSRTYRVPVTVG